MARQNSIWTDRRIDSDQQELLSVTSLVTVLHVLRVTLNQRVQGSSPWRCSVAANQAIACSFCYPPGRSNLRKFEEIPSGSRSISP
jgi:hypothetical protein